MNVIGIILFSLLLLALVIFAIVQVYRLFIEIKSRKEVKQFTNCEEIERKGEDN